MYHLWPESEYPDILLVHTTKGMQVSMDTQLLCSMEHSQRLTAPHKSEVKVQITHLEKDVSYKSPRKILLHIRCIASVHDYVLYYSCMLYDVYTGLVLHPHCHHSPSSHHNHHHHLSKKRARDAVTAAAPPQKSRH